MKKNIVTKAVALTLALLMASSMSACNTSTTEEGTATETVEKPAAISMTATTTITEENGLFDVAAKYKELTGIDLSIEKPDHNKYYEKITLSFASENPSDVIEMGSTYYPEYANSGVLWDMTKAWEDTTAPAKAITDETYVNALKIDDILYGFPMARGNGTITYVRQDWLDQAGLAAPTNYAEFIEMLRVFKKRGNGAIPLTAAGLINSETPYDIYLREFYQDATPDFYLNKDTGKYVDGMSEQAMKDALQRMRDAYAEGLIDAEVVTNKTSTCRDKVYAGLVGAFNYWAGSWATKIEDNTITSDPNAKFTAIPVIAESKYIERVPTAMVITNKPDSNKTGIFENLILYSHDGDEGQMLFTHGVQDIHYKINADGSYEALGYKEDPKTLVEKSIYAPELSITSWADPFKLDERVTTSLAQFQKDSVQALVPVVSDVISENLANLNVIKGEVIANVVHGNMSVDEGINDYQTRAKAQIDAILADLNK